MSNGSMQYDVGSSRTRNLDKSSHQVLDGSLKEGTRSRFPVHGLGHGHLKVEPGCICH